MNLQAWQAAARQNLAQLAGRLRRLAPGTLYGFLSATTLLPVVTAANQGDFAALVALTSMIGSVGGNLVANQIQAWKDRSEAELAAELQQRAVEELSGNVWEWTRSLWKGYPYPAAGPARVSRENLKAGPDETRVLRGSAYYGNRTDVRCAYRDWFGPYLLDRDLGFRVVVSPL